MILKIRIYKSYFFKIVCSLFLIVVISNKHLYSQSDGFLNLDGTNDRFEAVTTIFPKKSNVQSFTVETWIYPTEQASQFIATDDAYDLLVRYDSAAANNGLGITFTVWGTGGYRVEKTEYRDITLNQWNHVVGMFNAESLPKSQLTIAINGKISVSPLEFDNSSLFTDPNQHFALGGRSADGDINFRGYVDEVRVSSNSIRYTVDFSPKDYRLFLCDAYTKALFHFDGPDGSLSTKSDCNWEYILTAVGDAHITNRRTLSLPFIPPLLLYSKLPDLIVPTVTVSDSSLETSQAFTINATVENQGSGASASTTLRYYRSTNSTISTADTLIGTDPVSALSPDGTSAESTSAIAPSSTGTYWIGACVDSVSGESDTGNNCSSGVQITVSSSSTNPVSGTWTGPAGFGQLSFVVNSTGTGISEIKYTFIEFRCGPVIRNGNIRVIAGTPWPITDNQFTIEKTLDPNFEMTVSGTFDQTGTNASGNWEAVSYGTTCTGTWDASPIQ